MLAHETVKAFGAEQKVALAHQPEEDEWCDRKHIPATQISPNFRKLFDAFNRRNSRIIRSVHGADARAHHHVGGHAMRNERVQHSDLDRPEAASTRKNERCLQPASTTPFRECFDHPSGPSAFRLAATSIRRDRFSSPANRAR